MIINLVHKTVNQHRLSTIAILSLQTISKTDVNAIDAPLI